MHGTIEEIEMLDAHSKKSKGRVAVLYELLKRSREIMNSLSEEEISELSNDLNSNPILKSIISEPVVIQSKEDINSVSENYIPRFLTVKDVAEMLGITEQAVRRHCTSGAIDAWRTLGDKGEWRISVEPYKKHPMLPNLIEKYKQSNLAASKYIATNENIVGQLRKAKARRNDPTYYNNDPDKFDKLVNEIDEQGD